MECEFQEDFNKLMDLYHSIKQEVQRKDHHLYARWKAGGFLIDNDIISMYPNLEQVVESLASQEEEEEGDYSVIDEVLYHSMYPDDSLGEFTDGQFVPSKFLLELPDECHKMADEYAKYYLNQ